MLKYKIKNSGRNILSLLEYSSQQEGKKNAGDHNEEEQNSKHKKKTRHKMRSTSEVRGKEKKRPLKTESQTQTEVQGDYNYVVGLTNISYIFLIIFLSGSNCGSIPSGDQGISSG